MQTTMAHTKEVITQEELLHHWQGHRKLTRRVIEAFPEQEFFNFSIGGMRPFGAMVMELLGIAVPGLQEVVTGNTTKLNEQFDHGNQKAKLLELWDAATVEIDALFRQIPAERFHETINLFGMYENSVWSSVYYFIDNEIHHRGQGYVYLRALGIEPPPFWDRP
ncbi:damage-inducible protein DinB [Flavisolibacter sp. BT320]|nr:damage-inducible protein DinB [Flavisolibacter longurius]